MDTKWKNRKRIISFLVFFLGATLTLGSLMDILREKPSGVRIWQVDRLLEDDYQESIRFRQYVTNRFENLLIMATGGDGLWGIWGYGDGTYYGNGYDDGSLAEAVPEFEFLQEDSYESALSGEEMADYLQNLEYMQEEYLHLLEAMDDLEDTDREGREALRSDLEMYQQEMRNLIETMGADLPDRLSGERIKPLTDEQKQKIADRYHDSIKDDRNLLYTVLYDGKVLYSNGDLLPAEGSTVPEESGAVALSTAYGDIVLPEGYNFLLYFDGEKVRIIKDGRELDVYGDGYYREDSDWYLPGYTNFQVDDTVKKANLCMAVAENPVLYSMGAYGKGKVMQYDNSLYWMSANYQGRRERILGSLLGLGAGAALLLVSLLGRKSRREAVEGIARFQAKVWLECKVLLFLALFCGLFQAGRIFADNWGYGLWQEMAYAYEYNYDLSTAFWVGRELMDGIPSLFWIMVFWGLWLLWNDLRHNKRIWRCSLTAKLIRAFSAKGMDQPLPRKMFRRNRLLFLGGAVYAVLMLEQVMMVDTLWRGEYVRIIVFLLACLETILFLTMLCLTLRKNMGVARDVDALSRRIAEIRNGDYGEISDRASADGQTGVGQELQPVMAQLEDIRHGMAQAVDEQMKSERMKVELIANVSHDIKTPLTSIISYVEILKQEEGLPDYVRDYIKILDEKSQRLKNMVTDVFTVSKAASGELPIAMEELDFAKLLRQTLADMEEQIENSDVAFRTEIPEAPVMIMADGQRLYRVFQNLFENALKYSLQGSRVYVALHRDGSLAVASVKNISSQELERGRDFAERFARGDASRTDGGSGLGLSIAQSFTEACGGQFSWETDADLFIVKVAFQVQRTPAAPAQDVQMEPRPSGSQ